ncbi:MAG: hypothetical protein DRP61_04865 [Candidatus Omnitrophota bacterium]|nr:MAG: hypothetical protein DRP61_04865 [Candidatus Omnitrophota bacterium]
MKSGNIKNLGKFFKRRGKISFLENALLLNFSLFIVLVPYSPKTAKISFCGGVFFLISIGILKGKKKFLKIFSPPYFLKWPLFFFLISAIASTIFSKDIYHSQSILFERVIPYLIYLIMGAYLIQSNKKNIYILAFALVISAFIIGLGGAADYILKSPKRLFTVFGYELPFHSLALFLTFYIPFLTFLFIGMQKLWKKVILGVILLLLIICWMGAASRGAWLAVSLSIITVLGICKKKKWLVLTLVFLLIVFLVFPAVQTHRLRWIFDSTHWGHRPRLIQAAFNIFKDYPLLGAGLGMYEKLFNKYKPPGRYPKGFERLHAHNDYMELLSERGIFGLVGFLWILGLFFKKSFYCIRKVFSKDYGIFTGLTASLFSAVIFSFFSTMVNVGTRSAPFFWFLLGVASQFYLTIGEN